MVSAASLVLFSIILAILCSGTGVNAVICHSTYCTKKMGKHPACVQEGELFLEDCPKQNGCSKLHEEGKEPLFACFDVTLEGCLKAPKPESGEEVPEKISCMCKGDRCNSGDSILDHRWSFPTLLLISTSTFFIFSFMCHTDV